MTYYLNLAKLASIGKYFDSINDNIKVYLPTSGYIKFPKFLNEADCTKLSEDISALDHCRIRKDFIMPKYDTPRRLSVAGGHLVKEHCPVIKSLYYSDSMRNFIEKYTDGRIYTIDHPEEFIVVNFLVNPGDTHGWHLDDPRYAFIMAITVPEEGGVIELIPNWQSFVQSTGCADKPLQEQIDLADRNNLIMHENLEIGDAYLLDAAHTLHRITPLIKGRRSIINFAFHDKPAVEYGNTATLLYK